MNVWKTRNFNTIFSFYYTETEIYNIDLIGFSTLHNFQT